MWENEIGFDLKSVIYRRLSWWEGIWLYRVKNIVDLHLLSIYLIKFHIHGSDDMADNDESEDNDITCDVGAEKTRN